MKSIIIFHFGMFFTFLFVYQTRHYIKDEGDALHEAVLKPETMILGILGMGSWIGFIVYAIQT